MDGLLGYSLERITSLQLFYNSFKASIQEESERGKDANRFGFSLACYFTKLIDEGEALGKDKAYQALEKTVLSEVEVIKINDANGVPAGVTYRIKDASKLLAAGFELNVDKAKEQYLYYSEMPHIHASNTLVMLITRFEEFISDFLTVLYTMFPQRYLDAQKISFSEIVDIGVNEIRERIVTREVDEKMRASYLDWFKLFKDHKMNFNSCQNEMQDLCEIYARRNIIIHNSGKVNESYLSMVPNSSLKHGALAKVDDNYLHKAFVTIKSIIYKIMIEAERFMKDAKMEYLVDIFNHGFIELSNENYNVASKVFCELFNCRDINTEYKYMSQVNYWIAEIELHGLATVRSDIDAFDVSIFDDMFKLAKLVLLEEYDDASELICRMLKQENLSCNTIEQWPLFKRYAHSQQYFSLKSSHPEYFATSSFQIDNASSDGSSEIEHIRELHDCKSISSGTEGIAHSKTEVLTTE